MPTDAIMTAIPWASVKFGPSSGQELSRQGDGTILAKNLRDPLWMAELTSVQMDLDAFNDAVALIEALDGSIGTFYVWNAARAYPRLDPTGAILGAASVTIDALETSPFNLTLTGLPPLYDLSRGDMLSFDFGNDPVHRALHRIVTGGEADTSGDVDLTVFPQLRIGVTTALPVTLKKAAMEARLIPGSFEAEAGADGGRVRLSALQVV